MIGVADVVRGWNAPDKAIIGLLLLAEDWQRRGIGCAFAALIEQTILAWPEIGPRASLGLAPVPAELMAVFDKGQPMAIEFTFKKGGPLSLDGENGSARVDFQYDQECFTKDIDMPGIPGPRPWIATIRRKDKKPFTPGALTQLLRSLWWSADDASAKSIR